MSSSDRGQRGDGERDRPRSLTKFIRRTSKIISRPREQDAASSATSPPAASTARAPVVRARSPIAPPVPPKEKNGEPSSPSQSAPGRRPLPAASRPAPRNPSPEIVRATALNAAHHYRIQEQKARALFAKYNMTLEDGEWHQNRHATDREWVEKKIRLRVHRQCHRCQTGFGADKTCQQCNHTRCKKCPRYPDKGLRDHAKLPFAIAVDNDPIYQKSTTRRSGVLTMEGKHGTELVRKHPVQRVRRTCHKCETLFVGKAQECANCHHLRCPKCPREPPKEKKWPNGYPGDTPETFPLAERHFRTVRQRVRWQCHSCQTFFLDHERECRNCQHKRCDDCTRIPPKKVKKEPDPEVVRSLEQKLSLLQVSAAA